MEVQKIIQEENCKATNMVRGIVPHATELKDHDVKQSESDTIEDIHDIKDSLSDNEVRRLQ